MKALQNCGIRYCGGKNAPNHWKKCPVADDSCALIDKHLNEAQKVGTPGAGFGVYGEGYFRLSSFGNPDDTAEAARRIEKMFSK